MDQSVTLPFDRSAKKQRGTGCSTQFQSIPDTEVQDPDLVLQETTRLMGRAVSRRLEPVSTVYFSTGDCNEGNLLLAGGDVRRCKFASNYFFEK
jgi:hypothetical protein